jgi:RNA polymerase sigma-70 factor, ECF subfamily
MRPDADDAALVAAIADGDRDALRVLYQRHAPWLARRLGTRCADRDALANAVQDTFVAVWKGADKYTGRGDVAAWIWGIGIRRLIGQIRKRPPMTLAAAATPANATVESAEDRLLVGVEHGDLAGALHSLSPELRAVVQATVLDGLTTREAARLLGIPAGTVKTRMMRARAQLRGALA